MNINAKGWTKNPTFLFWGKEELLLARHRNGITKNFIRLGCRCKAAVYPSKKGGSQYACFMPR